MSDVISMLRNLITKSSLLKFSPWNATFQSGGKNKRIQWIELKELNRIFGLSLTKNDQIKLIFYNESNDRTFEIQKCDRHNQKGFLLNGKYRSEDGLYLVMTNVLCDLLNKNVQIHIEVEIDN